MEALQAIIDAVGVLAVITLASGLWLLYVGLEARNYWLAAIGIVVLGAGAVYAILAIAAAA